MFAGKTTELLRRVREARARGVVIGAFKPVTDDRYGQDSIVSHAGDSIGAVAIHRAEEIIDAGRGAGVIVVDEAHFFGASLGEVCAEILRGSCRVIVAGLERDHLGGPFEPFPALLCEADEVVKLSCACAVCVGPAIHSQRMIAAPGRIVVGGAGMYEARCRLCFRPARG